MPISPGMEPGGNDGSQYPLRPDDDGVDAQAVLHRLRCLLGEPYSEWDAGHLGQIVLAGLEGDIRVSRDTIVVTYYNAPNVDYSANTTRDFPTAWKANTLTPTSPGCTA